MMLHIGDIAKSQIDFRFRWKSGRWVREFSHGLGQSGS